MTLRWGASRVVFLIGRLACKVPAPWSWRSFLLGLLHNMGEVAFSRLRDPRLCPVLAYIPGGLLVVMPRTDDLPEWGEAQVCETNDIACPSPDRIMLPVESKASSWGLLDGRLVARDYGTVYPPQPPGG